MAKVKLHVETEINICRTGKNVYNHVIPLGWVHTSDFIKIHVATESCNVIVEAKVGLLFVYMKSIAIDEKKKTDSGSVR